MYNNNILSLIPNISKLAIKLIRNYFYMYNNKIEDKVRRKTKKIFNRRRKLSTNRIFLSKGEFKHTNNKVIITLYIYNKQKNNYLLKLKKRYINKFLINILSFKKNNIIKSLSKKNILSNKLVLLKKLKKISVNGTLGLIYGNSFYYRAIARILKELHEKKKINKIKV